jgi:hypothetical protein
MTVPRLAKTAVRCLLAVFAIACFVMGLPRAARIDPATDVPTLPTAKIAPRLPPASGRVVDVSTEAMLQAAVRDIASNTTIVLAPGTYRLTSTLWINGAVTNIAVRGATGNRDEVVLDGSSGLNAVPHGIWTGGGVRDVTIADLTIRGVRQHALIFNAGTQRPHVYNVRLVDAGQQFIKANPDAAGLGVNDGTVEYSLIEYTATAKDSYTNGVDVHAGVNWIVRDNEFRNIVSPPGAPVAGPAVLMWRGARGTLTEGNIFLNCARGIAYGLEERPGFDHQGGIIRGNVFIRTRAQPGDAAIVVADSPGTQVLGNTVVVSGTYATPLEYRFPGAHGVVVAGNCVDGAIRSRDGASGIERDNQYGRHGVCSTAASDAAGTR